MRHATHNDSMSPPKRPPNKERVTVTLRLPRWMAEWFKTRNLSRTEMIEFAVRRTYKLKDPK